MQLSNHLEVMNHEICDYDTEFEHEGYRVDGDNGIKIFVGLPNRKSVDYYWIKDGCCHFIEFSDLARGQEDLIGINEVVNQCENSLHRNKLSKLLRQDEWRCLAEKFKDSKDIFEKIPEFYTAVPAPFLDYSAKIFYIVHAPINDQLEESEKVEIARFLITLKALVSKQLEEKVGIRVNLIYIDKFEQELI